MEALARELDDAGNLVDYRHRRETLQSWSIPQADWQKLVAELSRRESPRDRARIEWGDNKRRIASVLVWMRVTQGEHLFAPLVLAASLTPGGRNILSRSVQQACHHISTGQAGPHYVDLADALDAHADLLAAHIDSRHGREGYSRRIGVKNPASDSAHVPAPAPGSAAGHPPGP
jgi:cytochrome c551/c552